MKTSTHNRTLELLKKHQMHTKKKYGQNYLIDDNVIDKIVSLSEMNPKAFIVEVGPGLGSITQGLLKASSGVLAYEIDGDLITPLKDLFKEEKDFHLIHDDVLNRDLNRDIGDYNDFDAPTWVVANLPYYITTPILFKFLEESDKISGLILMTQYEVAKRLTAQKNTKDYNALSVLMHYRCEAEFMFKVSKNVFIPKPNVDSAIIKLTLKAKDKEIDEPFFFDFVKEAFRQKRKTLVNNLNRAYYIEKPVLTAWLKSHDLNHDVRSESLDLETFKRLSQSFRDEFF